MKLLFRFCALAICLVLYASPASSATDCKKISKASAISVAQRTVKGKALSVTLKNQKSRQVYRVKMLLENGHVKTISVDACTGKTVSIKG